MGGATWALMPAVDWLDRLNPETILESFGPWAFAVVLAIIFAECGLLFGFFLPGDSLLFVTGIFIAEGYIDVPIWVAAASLAFMAIFGNVVGYFIGAIAGPRLFNKPDSRFFKQEYVTRTHAFFDRYGPMAIILARFIPIVRTFITAIAGVARMDLRKYLIYSSIGGIIWGGGVTVLGYYAGGLAIVRENIQITLLLLAVVTASPAIVEAVRHRRAARQK